MKTLVSWICTRPAHVAHGLTLCLLFAITCDGLDAYFGPALGSVLGWIFATSLSFAVVVGYSVGLRELLETGSRRSAIIAFCCLLISMNCSVAFFYRVVLGTQATEASFEAVRIDALRKATYLKTQVSSVIGLATVLQTRSAALSDDEEHHRPTCDSRIVHDGPRTTFRREESEYFASVKQKLDSIPVDLDVMIKQIGEMRPATGEVLEDVLRRLNAELAKADSIARSPGLAALAASLQQRSNDDDEPREYIGVNGRHSTFVCADGIIRQTSAEMAADLSKLPPLPPAEVTDLTDPRQAIVTILSRIWSKPTSLSGKERAMVGASVAVEVLVALMALLVHGAHMPGRVVRRLRERLNAAKASASDLFEAVRVEDPEIHRLFALVHFYTVQFGLREFVVTTVAPKRAQKDLDDLSKLIRFLEQLELARRDRWIFRALVWPATWLTLPATRGCRRRELWIINRRRLGALEMAEFLRRAAVDGGAHTQTAEEPPRGDAEASSGPWLLEPAE